MVSATSISTTHQDRRLTEVRHLNLRYPLPSYRSPKEWEQRAIALRWQVKIACGLFPPFSPTPLNPRRIVCYEDDEVIVERVAIETLPRFFLTGNLYRPKKGKPPFPAVLHPHGHVPQPQGRLYERERIRAMSMAKLGFIVFAYDMVGYGDQFQVVHRAPETPQEHLWGLSKGGLQTWNSIRALDFLLSLPEVDKKRIGCCGSSGGGTQTFLLAAVDERLAVAVPTKMVSAHMQGGCICENPPLLRIDTCNPEIVALFAPRPLLLISDDGDWTRETPQYEFPFIQSVYRLLNAEERCANAHFTEGHEFAQQSREAYYAWMVRWLKNKGEPLTEPIKEPPMELPDDAQWRVWGDDLPKPHNAITWDALAQWWKEQANNAIEQMQPTDQSALRKFQQLMRMVFQRTLAVDFPAPEQIAYSERTTVRRNGLTLIQGLLSRKGVGDAVPIVRVVREKKATKQAQQVFLLVSEQGAATEVWTGNNPTAQMAERLAQNGEVFAIDAFLTGAAKGERKRDVQFFATYNRTDDAERVQDILTSLAFLRPRAKQVHLVGIGMSGLWALLARAVAPITGRLVVDAAQFDATDDGAFVRHLFVPCLRRIGDVRTALALLAPTPLLVHNAHQDFPYAWATSAYRAARAEQHLRWSQEPLAIDTICRWLTQK